MEQSLRRSKFEIIYEILLFSSKKEVTITNIIYKVNLNFKIGQEYVNYLTEEGFLLESVNGEKKKIFNL
jgi:predicted transcriptional regulator